MPRIKNAKSTATTHHAGCSKHQSPETLGLAGGCEHLLRQHFELLRQSLRCQQVLDFGDISFMLSRRRQKTGDDDKNILRRNHAASTPSSIASVGAIPVSGVGRHWQSTKVVRRHVPLHKGSPAFPTQLGVARSIDHSGQGHAAGVCRRQGRNPWNLMSSTPAW